MLHKRLFSEYSLPINLHFNHGQWNEIVSEYLQASKTCTPRVIYSDNFNTMNTISMYFAVDMNLCLIFLFMMYDFSCD